MTIHIKNPINNDINATDRLFRESIYSKNFPKYIPKDCLSGINNVQTIEDLKNYLGRYDLSLLLQLTASKISSFSPVNFDDLVQYIDESYILLSCLWADTAETVNNSPTKDSSFNLGFEILNLLFDFFKTFRDAIRSAGEFLLVSLIKKFFIDVLELVDCTKINKCVIKCNPDANVYKDLHVKLGIKAGKETLLFLENKIKKNKLKDINKDKLLEFFGKTISKIQPNEFNCLLNGFISTNLFQTIKELFDSIFNGHDYTFDIRDLIEGIENIVDISPGPAGSLPPDPCGYITIETYARIQLRSQGKTDDEINQIIESVILESREKLERISQLIRDNPFNFNLDLNRNAEITNVIIRKSIDNIFDSFDQIQKTARTILNKILLRSIGDLNIGFYYLNNLNIEELDEYIKTQVSPIVKTSFISFNENFYSNYNLPIEPVKHFSINYIDNNLIRVSYNNIPVYEIQKHKLIELETLLELDLNNEELSQYINSKTRTDILDLLFLENNNDQLLAGTFNIQFNEVAQEVYNSTINYMNNQLSELFYFQEFYEDSAIAYNKKSFIEIDYFELNQSKQIAKERLNV